MRRFVQKRMIFTAIIKRLSITLTVRSKATRNACVEEKTAKRSGSSMRIASMTLAEVSPVWTCSSQDMPWLPTTMKSIKEEILALIREGWMRAWLFWNRSGAALCWWYEENLFGDLWYRRGHGKKKPAGGRGTEPQAHQEKWQGRKAGQEAQRKAELREVMAAGRQEPVQATPAELYVKTEVPKWRPWKSQSKWSAFGSPNFREQPDEVKGFWRERHPVWTGTRETVRGGTKK